MKKLFISAIIALMAINLGLYAQGKDTTQAEIKLELIWEKEFPESIPERVYGGITDVAFDKNRGGLFCPSVVVTGNPENAREIIYFDSTGEVVKRRKLKEWSQVRISENGKYIGIMHPEKWDKEFHYGPVDIINLSGKLVKRIEEVYGSWWWVSPKGNEVIEKEVWIDNDIYYFRGTPGKDTANLTKKEGNFTLFAGKPAIKWTGTENKYLQIGNLIGNLPGSGLPNGHSIAISPDGNYIAIPKAISKGKSYIYHLQLYTKYGILLKEFDLNKKGWLLSSFSHDSKYLAVAIKNLVFLIDVEKRKILWRYESDVPYQVLDLGTTLDFPSEPPFYVAGIFCHYSKNPLEKIMIFSKEGNVLIDLSIGKTLNRLWRSAFKVNSKGDMLCYVDGHKIRVFKLRGIK